MADHDNHIQHLKTVDSLVEHYSGLGEEKSYEYILKYFRLRLLKILNLDSNVPSVHDLMIIKYATELMQTTIDSDDLFSCQKILDFYKNRKVL